MRVLVSWEARKHDYIYKDDAIRGVNEQGTHCELYKYAFDYDCHYLLSGAKNSEADRHVVRLSNHLFTRYKKEVKTEFLAIKDVTGIDELLDKLRIFLVKLKEYEVEIFISPGTPSMQTVWYLLAYEFTNVSLFKTIPPKIRKENPYRKIPVIVNSGIISHAYAVREQLQDVITESIYKTPTLEKIYDLATDAASSRNTTVLILGQTGTGKEWLARHIHKVSTRRDEPFIAINCAAMNDDLLQSELFGHVQGAFTTATKNRDGAFVAADGGTIFLDEIGDISKKMQQSLLRVLQEKQVVPLGSEKGKKVDVRIIAATNQNLWEMTEKGTFRSDLYYRLAVAEIETVAYKFFPPEEKEQYVTYFIDKWKKRLDCRKIRLEKEVKKQIELHPFPGNFRELENLIERFYTRVGKDNIVTMNMIPDRIRYPEGQSFSLRIEDVKNAHYRKVYKMFKGNQTNIYTALDIHKNTWRKIMGELNFEN